MKCWPLLIPVVSFFILARVLLRPRSPRKFPIAKTGFYKRSKNFER